MRPTRFDNLQKLTGGVRPHLFFMIPEGEVNQLEYELKSGLGSVVRAEKDCDVYCPVCHKVLHIKAGEVIPRCCGRVMEVWN